MYRQDPNAPKKGLSGYMHFLAENRAKLKEEYPELTSSELMKKGGEVRT